MAMRFFTTTAFLKESAMGFGALALRFFIGIVSSGSAEKCLKMFLILQIP